MATLKDLIAQKEALELEIERTRNSERSDAIAKIRSLMEQHGLTPADFSQRSGAKKTTGKLGKVPAKYRNTATGETWSGRGLQPKWLKAAISGGRKLADFAV